jgi:hypothetical protein
VSAGYSVFYFLSELEGFPGPGGVHTGQGIGGG